MKSLCLLGAIRISQLAMIFAVAVIATSCTTAPTVSDNARTRLAPSGKLRLGLIGNPVLVTREASGELRGLAVDVGRAFAKELGVGFEPILYPTVAKLLEEGKSGGWDVTFLTPDPARAADTDFVAPLVDVEVTYLVSSNSPVQSVSGADQPGVRISVIQRSAPDLFLSRSLKHAEVVRAPGGPTAAFELLASGKAHAFAENRHMLLNLSEKLPGSRVLEGRIFVQQIALAVPKGRSSGLQFGQALTQRAKDQGIVQQAISRAGLRGVTVAPAASVN